MEKQGVPMNQYPQSPDLAHQQQHTPTGQPPVYGQDPNQQAQFQQSSMYGQQPQPGMPGAGMPYAGSPPPQQGGQQGYMSPQPTGMHAQQPIPHQHPQYAQQQPGVQGDGHPGMPPQQPSGQVYQSATPIASLGRGPAPADCPACGQRAMTNVSFETGNTTHAWALGLCCFTWCLCFIPYLMNSLKDVQHKCGKCGVLLATWHKSGTTEVHIHS